MLIVHKEFLSQEEEGGGAINYSIETTDYGHVYSSVNVSDCNRVVAISFGFSDTQQHKKKLNKINNFIRILEKFKEDFVKVEPNKSNLKYC